MRFIEKKPQGTEPLSLRLFEDKEEPPESDQYSMNFSLLTDKNIDIAAGRCIVKSDSWSPKYLYISAIHVEGHTNTPTKTKPNKIVGLGQLLVFSAIRYGLGLNIERALLVGVEGSEGFYLKMGFHLDISGRVNRMASADRALRSENGRLSTEWISRFAQASFENPAFRGPDWCGNISNIHLNLRQYIMNNWIIID